MFPSTAHRVYPKRLIGGFLLVLGLLAGYLLLPQGTLHAQAENTHTVSPGDTLTNIADRYGMTVEELMAINGLRNPNIVYIGQELIVSPEANPTETETEIETGSAITSTVTITGTTDSSSITETIDLTTTQVVTAPAVVSTEVTAPATTTLTATTSTTVTAPLTTSIAATTTTTTTVAATAALSTTTYTVQRGETLYMIAARFDTTPEVIAALNGLRNANLLYVGQELLVPFVEREEEADPTPTPTIELIEPTPTPTLIPPSPTPEPSPTATATSTPEPTPTVTPAPEELTTTYTVRTGDNLSSIAARFDATTDELLRLNGLANANYVYVGQRLRVPIIRDPDAPVAVDPTRISFPAGGTAASVDGTVIFPDQACYILEAAAGQEITVAVNSDGDLANFLVRAADSGVNGGVPLKRLESEERRWSYALPVTGDYIVCVATAEGAALYQLTVSIPAACVSVTQAIQTVDWEPFLQSDTALTHEDIGGDDYVTVAATAMTDTIATGGIPQIDQIVYGDFDGDCEEEAGVPLFSGGTAGNVGYLVYDAQTDEAGVTTPVLVAWGDGYKLGLTTDGGILIVSNALYNGWEPNCCPSGRSYDSYRLTDSTLTLLATRSEGFTEAHVPTVLQFYELLQSGSYTEAYAFLSPTLQAENPYESWVAGYANTETIDATIEADPETAGRVLADLQVTERLSSGTARIRHYTGYWNLVWDGSIPGWILQDGSFTVVP